MGDRPFTRYVYTANHSANQPGAKKFALFAWVKTLDANGVLIWSNRDRAIGTGHWCGMGKEDDGVRVGVALGTELNSRMGSRNG